MRRHWTGNKMATDWGGANFLARGSTRLKKNSCPLDFLRRRWWNVYVGLERGRVCVVVVVGATVASDGSQLTAVHQRHAANCVSNGLSARTTTYKSEPAFVLTLPPFFTVSETFLTSCLFFIYSLSLRRIDDQGDFHFFKRKGEKFCWIGVTSLRHLLDVADHFLGKSSIGIWFETRPFILWNSI